MTFQLTPTEYASFRTVLTLTADVYEMLDSLRKGNALMELTEPLNKIYRHTQNYKELKHFITHLGEHICKFDSHAVKERAPDTAYTNSRTPSGHFELIWERDTIRFTRNNQRMHVSFRKRDFDPIFTAAYDVYKELACHRRPNRETLALPIENPYPLDTEYW